MTELLGEYGRRRVVRSVINGWTGSGVASKDLPGHVAYSQHHISVAFTDPAATGTFRIRLVPTGMNRAVSIREEMEEIILNSGEKTTFIVSGFYQAIEAEFTTPLSAGTATITIASVGEHLSALPVPGAREHGRKRVPHTVIATGWDGLSPVGREVPSHVGMGLHHIAIASSATYSGGFIRVFGKPLGSDGFVRLTPVLNLVDGTLNVFVVGFYEEFQLQAGAIGDPVVLEARVASAGEDLNTLVDLDSTYVTEEEAAFLIGTAIANHEALPDPHPQYATDTALADGLALKIDTSRGFGRNWLMNGHFLVWQRGSSLAAGTGKRFGADRWAANSANTTVATSQQQFTFGHSLVPGNPLAYHRTVVSSVAGANNFGVVMTSIENVSNLSGETVTLSFWAKADANKSMSVEFYQEFGSGGSAVVNSIGVTQFNLTTSWQKFTTTVAIPSVSGKTPGANNCLVLLFWFDAGSSYNSRTLSLGQQSGTFDMVQMKLEKGSVATDYEEEDYNDLMSRCQRYFEVVQMAKATGVTYTPNGDTRAFVPMKVIKRTSAPTVTQSGSMNVIAGGDAGNVINVSLGTVSLTATDKNVNIDTISNFAAFSGCGAVMSWGDNGAGGFTAYVDAEL